VVREGFLEEAKSEWRLQRKKSGRREGRHSEWNGCHWGAREKDADQEQHLRTGLGVQVSDKAFGWCA
jgi:hypothetical protein